MSSKNVEGIEDVDVKSVVELGENAGAGLPAGPDLARFARAVIGEDDVELANARRQLVEVVGLAGAADAACATGAFALATRAADGTGLIGPSMPEVAAEHLPEVDWSRLVTPDDADT